MLAPAHANRDRNTNLRAYLAAMGIRFSLKWLLTAMVYVALAAAAFTQDHWAWADVLWLVSFVAVCYAAALAFNAAGERRSRSIGFPPRIGPISELLRASAERALFVSA